ncbi:MAG: hypothetical protein HYT63_03815 [Candidatus Yanofskybacteria bacterium]|nr:hypothetical protein [Candidatus Yanofskybacteria bacterium]
MSKVNKTGSKILKVYKKAAGFIGRINTKIILSIFYFTIVPLFKVVFLLVKPKKKLSSNWKIKEASHPDGHGHSF